MQIIDNTLQKFDAFQQRHTVLGFIAAVFKKQSDDQVSTKAATLTYYAFLTIFPLLMVSITVLTIVLHDNADLRQRIIHYALENFPGMGGDLQRNVSELNRAGFGLVVGIVLAVWGLQGVANNLQHTLNDLWGVPQKDRPGFLPRILRSYALLGIIALDAVATAFVTHAVFSFGIFSVVEQVFAFLAIVLLNFGVFVVVFKLGSAARLRFRDVWAGSFFTSVCWSILHETGNYLISRQLHNLSDLYGSFALVLGLLFWLYLMSQVLLLAVEIDVVLVKRRWPTRLFTPPATPAPSSFAKQ